MDEQFFVKARTSPTTQPKCGKCVEALLKALTALMKALKEQAAQKALTTMCECPYSDPHLLNGARVRKLIQCTICADINRAQSALNNFRSADGVVIDICNCNKH